MSTEHGHGEAEIESRIGLPPGRGYLRDTVYGAIDGAVTTFAIVAGVAGAGLAPGIVVTLGIANVLADGFSMAAGNYSATKAELDDIRRLRAVEERHINTNPEGERRELRQILARKGLDGPVLEAATDAFAKDRDAWIQLMIEGEYGIATVEPHPIRAALATFAAFLVAGFVPLVPFLFALPNRFELATFMTALCFFLIGTLKSHWSLAPWWRSGAETLLIGGAAAVIAYLAGSLFQPV